MVCQPKIVVPNGENIIEGNNVNNEENNVVNENNNVNNEPIIEPVVIEEVLNVLNEYENELNGIRDEFFEILWRDELEINPQRLDETDEMLLVRKNTFRLIWLGDNQL